MATTLVDGKGLPAAPVVPLATGPSVSTTAAPTPGPMTTLLGEDGPNKEDGDEDEEDPRGEAQDEVDGGQKPACL